MFTCQTGLSTVGTYPPQFFLIMESALNIFTNKQQQLEKDVNYATDSCKLVITAACQALGLSAPLPNDPNALANLFISAAANNSPLAAPLSIPRPDPKFNT